MHRSSIKHRVKTVQNSSKHICGCSDVRDNRRSSFSLEEALLWIIESCILSRSEGLEIKHLFDGFVSYTTQLFTSQDVN